MHFIRKRLYFLVLATVALLLHNAVHESIHYLAASISKLLGWPSARGVPCGTQRA